jgi:hypothetical protein
LSTPCAVITPTMSCQFMLSATAEDAANRNPNATHKLFMILSFQLNDIDGKNEPHYFTWPGAYSIEAAQAERDVSVTYR